MIACRDHKYLNSLLLMFLHVIIIIIIRYVKRQNVKRLPWRLGLKTACRHAILFCTVYFVWCTILMVLFLFYFFLQWVAYCIHVYCLSHCSATCKWLYALGCLINWMELNCVRNTRWDKQVALRFLPIVQKMAGNFSKNNLTSLFRVFAYVSVPNKIWLTSPWWSYIV